ncbi:glucose-6-phosphate isomerase [Kaistia sp. 32K]|uniref:glucose-6-phosphate isomerase family protein n=1 Tax=Kaistia sp. 32K TaxID=2795690 RepID=UPI001916BD11|nr:glucose-6-phosphate isomerase family protein [Kaistia sp. 32K]BCP55523.1 glucose-6-phosphate isomerase [Kaistia sp. 32K]
MAIPPTSHRIDPASGVLSDPTGRYEKRLADLGGIYADADAFAAAVAREGDRVVYTVHEVRPAAARGDLIFGTTFMEPGRIGDEFFVTRGHIHAIGNRPETYYGEAGEGVMLLESPEGETRILEIAPRVMVYVPPLWIHRSVNTGAAPLVMSFCYPSDSGQDYGLIARSGGMATRIVADGAAWKAVPNASYRPRAKAEIDAILATQD